MANPKGTIKNLDLEGRFQKIDATETAAIGRKGAIASNKVQKEKKKLKESLEIALEIMAKKKLRDAKAAKDVDLESLINESGLMAAEYASLAFDSETPEIRLRALKDIADRVDGKVVDKQANTDAEGNTVNREIVYIEREDKEAYEKHIQEVINENKES